MPGDFAALERARIARDPRDRTAPVAVDTAAQAKRAVHFVRSDWAVAKVFDDGRPAQVLRYNLTAVDAEAGAGRQRDAMTDLEVALAAQEGWTYKAITTRGTQRQAPRIPYAAGRGIGAMSPEKRREISRKANAARWGK